MIRLVFVLRRKPGTTLGQVPAEQMNNAFFIKLERLLDAVHARGIVHLDTRGTGNMLQRPDGRPALIAFQVSLGTHRMPASWQQFCLVALHLLSALVP